MIFQSKSIRCLDCGASFIFSAVEQEYFNSRGNAREPEYCPSCRQARKERQETETTETAAPRQSEHQMFSANCARCGKRTELPFEPHAGRPVYCSDCYDIVRGHR